MLVIKWARPQKLHGVTSGGAVLRLSGLLLAKHLDHRNHVEENHHADDVGLHVGEDGSLIRDGGVDGGIDSGMGGGGGEDGGEGQKAEQVLFHGLVVLVVCVLNGYTV